MKKKVCLLGVSAVGKTSLVRRFVHSIFTDKYHSTLGVKIDAKKMQVNNQDIDLLIWDIHGDEEYKPIHKNYLRGMAGYLLVADGTRRDTLGKALQLKDNIEQDHGDLPFVVLLNKADLETEWEINDMDINSLVHLDYHVFNCSAKTGLGVEEAFTQLAQEVIDVSNKLTT